MLEFYQLLTIAMLFNGGLTESDRQKLQKLQNSEQLDLCFRIKYKIALT